MLQPSGFAGTLNSLPLLQTHKWYPSKVGVVLLVLAVCRSGESSTSSPLMKTVPCSVCVCVCVCVQKLDYKIN